MALEVGPPVEEHSPISFHALVNLPKEGCLCLSLTLPQEEVVTHVLHIISGRQLRQVSMTHLWGRDIKEYTNSRYNLRH